MHRKFDCKSSVLFQNKKFLFQNKSNNKKNFVIKNIFYTQFFFFIIPTIVFNIFNYLIAIFKKNNFLFINTCYPENSSFSFFKNYKLNSYLKYFLEKFNPMFVNSGRRDYFVREKFKNFFTTFFFSKNKFEFFLKNKIYNDMPSYLLENFKNYLNRNFKINDSKAILTSYDLYSKFPNKFYIAEQVNKGAKLYLIEHGGSLTAQKETLDLDLDIVDKKITWFKPFNRKQSQIPTHPFHYLKIISKEKNNINKKNCILIGGGEYKHIWNSTYYLKPSQIIEQLENIKKFYNILDIKVKRKTFIKPHEGYTSDVTFDLIKYYVNIFNKKIIRKTSLEKCINSSKMVICVYPETTFALSMYSSVPTVLFYNKDHYIFHKQTDNLINILIKNNIIFYDPKLAAKHINKVWDNPVAWFNSTEVKKARNLFLKIALGIEFPRNLTKERKHWESILQ